MKRLIYLAIVGVMVLAGCENKRQTQTNTWVASADTDSMTAQEDAVIDTTLYGECGMNTAMHTLELITEQGDTLTFLYDNEAQGGLNVGDKLAVIWRQDKDGAVAEKIINLTSLMGKWSDLQRSIELKEDGSVVSNIKEPRPYLNWAICNGQLVLSSDTFSIRQIGPDSLYLHNNQGTIGLRRR